MTRKKKKTKKRPRTVRRERLRKLDKLAAQRRKLAALEAGGHIDRPITLASASMIAGWVRQLRCAGCDERLRIEHETATRHAGRVIRQLRLQCYQCGEPRVVYVALRAVLN